MLARVDETCPTTNAMQCMTGATFMKFGRVPTRCATFTAGQYPRRASPRVTPSVHRGWSGLDGRVGYHHDRARENLAETLLPERTPKKRMLVIVNPYATTVSDRLKNLVVYALESRYAVEAVDTEKPTHATQICREAAREGYDVVVAFGGDGTVNEAANGLAGSDTPSPACRAARPTSTAARSGSPGTWWTPPSTCCGWRTTSAPRAVDLGRVNDRQFTFSSGVGLDASVVERVDAHPRMKARLSEYYYTYAAITTFTRRYLVRPPHVRVRVPGGSWTE